MPLTSALYNPFPEEITVEMVNKPEGPAANLFGGGRARTWTLQRTGMRGRPSFRGLEDMLTSKLDVGQELILDAPTAEELEQYVRELRKIARRHGVTLRWDGTEPVLVNVESDERRPWETRKTYRFRCYVVILARRSGTGWMAFADEATELN